MTDPTPLTPESEALLAHASIRARFLNDVTMGKPRPGSIPWLRDELIAIEAAVTARVLADVAARLPEALKALALASNLGADYDADSILEALRNA